MKTYRLKKWYPSLYDDIEVGTIVDYEDGWIYYTNKRGNRTTVEMDEWELSHKDFWELIEKDSKPLFIAKDGAVFFDDFYYLVTKPYFVKTKLKAKENIYKGDGFIYFKHEFNADEFVWRNKPVFSYNDIEKFQSGGEGVWYDVKAIAKERSKE